MKSREKILLTGASGAVGRQVLKQLVDSKLYDVMVFDRKTRASMRLFNRYKKKIKLIYGDISNVDDLKPATGGVSAVIHLAAIIPPLADNNPELAYRVNVKGTKNLIESLRKNSENPFFLYASSVSVYGDRVDNPMIRIGDPLNPSDGDEYARTKIQAEEIIRNSGLKWSIFRLSAIMGVNNHKVSGLMFHMPLSTPMEITTPGDTARAFVNALNAREHLKSKVFNLGGGKECRILYSDFLSRSFNLFGLGKLNFPKYAFARRNFHCGYYEDGDDLNDILDFRQDNIESYFQNT